MEQKSRQSISTGSTHYSNSSSYVSNSNLRSKENISASRNTSPSNRGANTKQKDDALIKEKENFENNLRQEKKEKEEAMQTILKLESQVNQWILENKVLKDRCFEMENEKIRTKHEMGRLHEEVSRFKLIVQMEIQRKEELEKDLIKEREKCLQFGLQMENLSKERAKLQREVSDKCDVILSLEKVVLEKKEEIFALQCDKREAEMERRRLFQQMQELKGTIRVFCRIRPFLRDEKDEGYLNLRTSVKSLELSHINEKVMFVTLFVCFLILF